MDDYTIIKKAIEGQGALILETIRPLTFEEWRKPSRLPGWDVFTLVAHTMRAPKVLVEYGANPLNEPPVRDRYNYWRFEGRAVAASISDRAHETAASTSPAEIIPLFEHYIKEAVATLERLAPDTVTNSTFGPIRLADYGATRVIELSIHGLDLLASLSLPLRLDPEAQAITVQTLEALIDRPRPADLADDLAFIEVASGRVPYEGVQISAFS